MLPFSRSYSNSNETFIPLIGWSKYEISTTYPYRVRNASNKRFLKETLTKQGYILNLMNDSSKPSHVEKHKMVATMFIPNDNPTTKRFVIRINGDITDFRLENLMWSSSKKLPYKQRSFN